MKAIINNIKDLALIIAIFAVLYIILLIVVFDFIDNIGNWVFAIPVAMIGIPIIGVIILGGPWSE